LIPDSGTISEIIFKTQPTNTYKLSLDKDVIAQYADGIEAMRQMAYKTLLTDRYRYYIYDWNYGVEIDDLMGKPILYVKSELIRRIQECLEADDRVNSVTDFSFPDTGNAELTPVSIKFHVNTIFGVLEAQKEYQLYV
jgi:hypothetical protein